MKFCVSAFVSGAFIVALFACNNHMEIETPRLPRIIMFEAHPDVIAAGDSSLLKWLVVEGNFTGEQIFIEATNDSVRVSYTGLNHHDSLFVHPDRNTVFRLIASSAIGFTSEKLMVTVQ